MSRDGGVETDSDAGKGRAGCYGRREIRLSSGAVLWAAPQPSPRAALTSAWLPTGPCKTCHWRQAAKEHVRGLWVSAAPSAHTCYCTGPPPAARLVWLLLGRAPGRHARALSSPSRYADRSGAAPGRVANHACTTSTTPPDPLPISLRPGAASGWGREVSLSEDHREGSRAAAAELERAMALVLLPERGIHLPSGRAGSARMLRTRQAPASPPSPPPRSLRGAAGASRGPSMARESSLGSARAHECLQAHALVLKAAPDPVQSAGSKQHATCRTCTAQLPGAPFAMERPCLP